MRLRFLLWRDRPYFWPAGDQGARDVRPIWRAWDNPQAIGLIVAPRRVSRNNSRDCRRDSGRLRDLAARESLPLRRGVTYRVYGPWGISIGGKGSKDGGHEALRGLPAGTSPAWRVRVSVR